MNLMLQSLQLYFSSFSVDKAIILIMAIFMIIGGIDKINGNKRGYGEQFDAGFKAMGELAIAMVGMISLVPVINVVLGNIIGSFFSMIGADPSLFAGILIGTDLGGYQLAMGLADNEAIGNFNGMITTSMMGACLVFNIPVGIGLINEEDHPYFAGGMLIGFATIPIGCISGGLVMIVTGYELTISDIIMNTIPVIVVSILIILGLIFFREKLMRGFISFGNGVSKFITFGTIIATFQYLTGIKLPLFHVMVEADQNGTVPLINAIEIVGCISLVLIGAFPMVKFLTNTFSDSLKQGGAKVGLNEISIAGMIATAANNIPTFQMLENMNVKGKIMNCAFIVSASFVLGDHLGFCAGANSEMIAPMLVAKFAGGISAVILANFVWQRFCPEK